MLKYILWILISTLALLIFYFIVRFGKNVVSFNKCVKEYFPASKFKGKEKKQKYKEYKMALKRLNQAYNAYYPYSKNNHQVIFKCEYLVEGKINEDYLSDLQEVYQSYRDKKIREEALNKIEDCLKNLYILISAINYFENQIDCAKRTIDLISTENRTSPSFIHMYQPLINKRVKYLNAIIQQCDIVIQELDEKADALEDAIRELEKMKKTTILGMAFNIITAPIRHTFNMIDSIIQGDEGRFVKSATMLGMTFIGVGIIGEAIEAIDALDIGGIEQMELSSDIHQVDSHLVDSYYREDGTFVSGYERGGEDGYFRSDPDGIVENNLR